MFKQANRNAVLMFRGHRKRIFVETNLVAENESAIFSKGRQFTSAKQQNSSLSSNAKLECTCTKMIVKSAWRSGTDPEFPTDKVYNTVVRELGTAQIQAIWHWHGDFRKSHFYLSFTLIPIEG